MKYAIISRLTRRVISTHRTESGLRRAWAKKQPGGIDSSRIIWVPAHMTSQDAADSETVIMHCDPDSALGIYESTDIA